MSVHLYELTTDYQKLLDMMEDPEADEEIIRDTLEAIEGDIEVKADGYAAMLTQLEAEAEMLMVESTRLARRARTLQNRADRLKQYLLRQLDMIGMKKLYTRLHTFTIRQSNPSVVITSEDDIPEKYFKMTRSINKSDIKKAIDAGEEVPGAILRSTESLLIR